MINFSVSFNFGVITMTAGIIGVPLGSYLSTNYIKHYPRIDPVICAMGLLISAPLIAFSIFFITESPTAAYISVFIGQVALNCNWAVVADMLLVRFTIPFICLCFYLCFLYLLLQLNFLPCFHFPYTFFYVVLDDSSSFIIHLSTMMREKLNFVVGDGENLETEEFFSFVFWLSFFLLIPL